MLPLPVNSSLYTPRHFVWRQGWRWGISEASCHGGLLSTFVNLLWLKPSFDVRLSSLKKTGWHRKSEISARVGHNFYGWFNGGKIYENISFSEHGMTTKIIGPFTCVGVHHFRFKIRFCGTEMAFFGEKSPIEISSNIGIWPMKNGYHGNTMWYNVKCGCVYIYI